MTTVLPLTGIFPAIDSLEPGARRTFDAAVRPLRVRAGTRLFDEGSRCEAYLLVLEGSVRVQKVSDSGREIVLYRVEPGQTCVLTTSCLMANTDYNAEGIAETEIHALALSATAFQSLLATSARFREFVFSAYATRIGDLLLLIEEVAFGRMDQRLAQWLLARRDGAGQVSGTHQDVAMELGSAREVISRQLKEFERRGWVRLHRGRIEVVDASGLENLAQRDKR